MLLTGGGRYDRLSGAAARRCDPCTRCPRHAAFGVTGLEHHLLAALPHLSDRVRGVVHALVLSGGTITGATKVARSTGVSSRFALGRMMRRAGLPALHELAAWVRLFGWVTRAEQGTGSLFAIATHSGKSPAVCYATVKRITGLTWLESRSLGSRGILRLLLHRCEVLHSVRTSDRGKGCSTAERPAAASPARYSTSRTFARSPVSG